MLVDLNSLPLIECNVNHHDVVVDDSEQTDPSFNLLPFDFLTSFVFLVAACLFIFCSSGCHSFLNPEELIPNLRNSSFSLLRRSIDRHA